MQLVTYGHLHISVVRVHTDLVIDEIREGMQERKYAGNPPSSGWGAVRWQDENDKGPVLSRTAPGNPSVAEFGDRRVLLGRLIFDQENLRLERQVGELFETMPAGIRYLEDAVDVVLLDDDPTTMLVATHDADDVVRAVNRLRDAVLAADSNAEFSVEYDPDDLTPDSDLFLWMLERYGRQDGDLGDGMKIIEYRTLSTVSSAGGLTRCLRGVGLDRIDTLGAVAEGHDLGPAKFAVYDPTLGLVADLFLLLDGKFDVHRQGTEYDEQPFDRADLGIRASVDVATRVLPKLKDLHASDGDWTASVRQEFRKWCNQTILDRYS